MRLEYPKLRSMAHVPLSECNICSWRNSLRFNYCSPIDFYRDPTAFGGWSGGAMVLGKLPVPGGVVGWCDGPG